MINTINVQLDSALEKEKKLIKQLQKIGRVLVAYSGGVDSTYLMAVAYETLGKDAQAVLMKGAMIPSLEVNEAIELAHHLDLPLEVMEVDITGLKDFTNNSIERCYFCKKYIFTHFLNYAKERNFPAIIDGTNVSDEADFRPGRKALIEFDIISPLQTVGLSKEDIRILSKKRGLPTWKKPSMACLASRVPYGDKITESLLKRIDEGEKILVESGFEERRLRVHGDLARIEIPLRQFPLMMKNLTDISKKLSDLGFRFVTLDLMGLRTGSFNPQEDLNE